MAQSIEMYRALKSLDVPTRLLVAPNEPHLSGGLRHTLMKANIEIEWFEKCANHRAYVLGEGAFLIASDSRRSRMAMHMTRQLILGGVAA